MWIQVDGETGYLGGEETVNHNILYKINFHTKEKEGSLWLIEVGY